MTTRAAPRYIEVRLTKTRYALASGLAMTFIGVAVNTLIMLPIQTFVNHAERGRPVRTPLGFFINLRAAVPDLGLC